LACHPSWWTENSLSLRLIILFCWLFMVHIYTPRMYILTYLLHGAESFLRS
jgi:hypothetical protein